MINDTVKVEARRNRVCSKRMFPVAHKRDSKRLATALPRYVHYGRDQWNDLVHPRPSIGHRRSGQGRVPAVTELSISALIARKKVGTCHAAFILWLHSQKRKRAT